MNLSLNAANKSPIDIQGAFFARITGVCHDGTPITTRTMVYVSKDVKGFYISEETMHGLGMLHTRAPTPRCALESKNHEDSPPLNDLEGSIRALHGGCSSPSHCDADDTPCKCPQRQAVPPRHTKLPFECKPENNSKMKGWLLDYFRSSTFNMCPHSPLPCMAGPHGNPCRQKRQTVC